jgi:hypothetical protein
MKDLLERIGTFKVSRSYIRKNPEDALKILKDVLIVRVDNDFSSDSLTYLGYSEHFNLVNYNEMPPNYTYDMKVDTGEITWHSENKYTKDEVVELLNEISGMIKCLRK